MVLFHLSKIYSAGCAGGRCRRRARPGKEAEGRLPLRVLSYYSTGNSYCKVKFYDPYRIFRLFCLRRAKKYRPRLWAARWDGAGRMSGPSVIPAGASPPPAVPTPARTPGRGSVCCAHTPGNAFRSRRNGGPPDPERGKPARWPGPSTAPRDLPPHVGQKLPGGIVPQPPAGSNRKFPSPAGDFCRPAGRMHPADAGLMRLPPGGRERNGACPAPNPVPFSGGCAPGRRVHPKPAVSDFSSRGSPPRTRVTFCTHKKSPKRRWGDPSPPLFVQSVCIRF